MKDDTWLNPADKQIALFVIKELVEFCGDLETFDCAGDPSMAVDMGKKLLKRHHILLEGEYAELS